MSYEPLHHKYRPQTFAELVGQEAIAQTLTNAISSRKIVPAYLLTGPRGTGKTSSARILAKSLNCLASQQPTPTPCGQCEVCRAIARGTALDVVEIDAASNTGVDNIREVIERAQFAPVQCRYKVYVIDECHMLSTAAFNALLKTLEEPPQRVVFVLATTDPQRVLPTIISRCQRFDYRRIPTDAMVTHLQKIAQTENISISDEALFLVAQVANGGLRDAQSLLDQLSLLSGTVTPQRVWDLVGAVPEQDLLALLAAIARRDPEAILERCRSILNRGREPLVVLQNLAAMYLNLLIAKTAPQQAELVTVTEATWQQLCAQATNWEIGEILRGQQLLRNSEAQLKNTTQPRLWLEIALVELLPSAVVPVETAPPPPPEPVAQPAAETPPEPTLPAPIAQPAPSCSSPPTAVPVSDSEKVWQQMLEQLHPPTTQALLSQHCYLLNFDGAVAHIGAKNKALLGIAQNKLTNIEAAFEAVCQRKIAVKLRVSEATSSEGTQVAAARAATNSDEEARFPTSISTTESIPQNQRSTGNTRTDSGSEDFALRSVLPSVASSRPQQRERDPSESEQHQLESSFTPVSDSVSDVNTGITTEASGDEENDEVLRAAESLAQCFEGEIISQNERSYIQHSHKGAAPPDEVTESSSASQQNHTAMPEPSPLKPLILGRPDIADDDDIPF